MVEENKTTLRSLRILPIAVMTAILLLTAAACRRTPQCALDAMDHAEALMEEHPDSALAVMQTVDTADLHGAADRARRALLMTMAVDKNLIDTTDFRILQPAIDYYERHGSPDQRLKTRYYQGRIFMNQGKDDAALTSLLRAAEDSAGCTDSLALARVYVLQGTLEAIRFNYEEYIRLNMEAGKIYAAHGDTVAEIRCMARALDGAATIADIPVIESLLVSHESIFRSNLDKIDFIPNALTVAFMLVRPASELQKLIEDIDTIPFKSPENRLDIAMAWNALGQPEKAYDYLPELGEFDTLDDSIKYRAIRNDILENLGKEKELLKGYQSILTDYENFANSRFRAEIIYTPTKHALESSSREKLDKSERKKSQYWIASWIALAIGVALGVIYGVKAVKFRALKVRYSKLLSQLDWERNRLESISTLDERVRSVIDKRLRILNQLMVDRIRKEDPDMEALNEELKIIHEQKEEFLASIRDFFSIYHSEFIKTSVTGTLTQTEVNYLALVSIGLETQDVACFLELKSIYNVTYSIRKKLGLSSEIKNLTRYLEERFRIS